MPYFFIFVFHAVMSFSQFFFFFVHLLYLRIHFNLAVLRKKTFLVTYTKVGAHIMTVINWYVFYFAVRSDGPLLLFEFIGIVRALLESTENRSSFNWERSRRYIPVIIVGFAFGIICVNKAIEKREGKIRNVWTRLHYQFFHFNISVENRFLNF